MTLLKFNKLLPPCRRDEKLLSILSAKCPCLQYSPQCIPRRRIRRIRFCRCRLRRIFGLICKIDFDFVF